MTGSEKELIAKARQFDMETLEYIYDQYSDRLYIYSMRLLGNSDLAEECVAETFHRFLQALKNKKGPNDYLKAYLYRIAHNWIADKYRHKSFTVVELDETCQADENSTPANYLDDSIQQKKVQEALCSLTLDQRQVIILHYYEGWGNEQIAYALGKTEGAVKALQHRALIALRQHLIISQEESR